MGRSWMDRLPGRVIGMVLLIGSLASPVGTASVASAQEVAPDRVVKAIERAQAALTSEQLPDGSWRSIGVGDPVGLTALVTRALLDSGLPSNHPQVKRGLDFLRKLPADQPTQTYDLALTIMALAAARDGQADVIRLARLAQRLEGGQIQEGEESGMWGYTPSGESADRSNTQFALLGLQEAAFSGIPIDRDVWKRSFEHFTQHQSGDGGWGYKPGMSATGSMTVAGISSLAITATMLRDEHDLGPDGNPACCGANLPSDAMDRASSWMGRHFTVRSNPEDPNWWLYYMYGLERAGRLSGQRFFGDHDWYREGVEMLVQSQGLSGTFRGSGAREDDEVLATAYCLLFLSKGLAPVVINKVKFGPSVVDRPNIIPPETWSKHPHDVRNISEHLSRLEGWPKLLTWQEVNLPQAARKAAVAELRQSPILFLASDQDVNALLSDAEVDLLREYMVRGGFVLAVRNCESRAFDRGLRDLVRRLYPDEQIELKPLESEHAVYRSWYPLDASTVPLEGVDVGCRTALIYCPEDLSCLWDKWMVYDPPRREQSLSNLISRAMRIAVNIVAYATGGELLNKLEQARRANELQTVPAIEDGYLRIAQIKHSGDWDAAPTAVRNLLMALRKTVNQSSSTQVIKLPASDETLYRYSLLFMHGQQRFRLPPQEIKRIRQYLEQGGVLFADACCGAEDFDKSFRQLMDEMFPEQKFERIPVAHELFSSDVAFDVRRVRRRGPANATPGAGLTSSVQAAEPYLEGILIDGRYAVIYSKYDISCALEQQSSGACLGYIPEDAVRLAINVVVYAILQDARYFAPPAAAEPVGAGRQD